MAVLSGSTQLLNGRTARSIRCYTARMPAKIVAFKDTDPNVSDWRTQKMIQTARTYYTEIWNKGDMASCDRVIDPSIVFRDQVWADPSEMVVVGQNAFKRHVQEFRSQYPDDYFLIDQMGVQDYSHLFVRWTCHATQLESPHGPPSYHTSTFSGVDILAFDSARDKVLEVEQFRQPTAEEKRLHAVREETNAQEIKLARLHWEPYENRPVIKAEYNSKPSRTGRTSSRSSFKKL